MSIEQFAYNTFLMGFGLAAFTSLLYVLIPLWSRIDYFALATGGEASVRVPARGAPPHRLRLAATAFAWLTLLVLSLSLAGRWIAAGRPPLSNMWEVTVAFGWGVLLFQALFEVRLRLGPGTNRQALSNQYVGAVLLPTSLILLAVSLVSFPSVVQPLVPALQANRILGAHVATMMLSYAALSVSFGAAAVYLVQNGPREGLRRLYSSETVEEIAYRSVLIGFPLLTLGVTLGAYWAYSAWGRYWGWDPKETSALITWLIYAGYLHARGLRGWKGRGAAWLLVLGFGSVLFGYFGVNLWIAGLHSYAGV